MYVGTVTTVPQDRGDWLTWPWMEWPSDPAQAPPPETEEEKQLHQNSAPFIIYETGFSLKLRSLTLHINKNNESLQYSMNIDDNDTKFHTGDYIQQ